MNAELNHSRPRAKHLYVTEENQHFHLACPEGAITAVVGRDITFNAAVLDSFDVKGFQPVHYDLMVLCAAIELADRRWKRPRGWRRDLHVTIPVIDLGSWQDREALENLHSVLRHLTCDDWNLTFVQAKNPSPVGTRQGMLNFPNTKTFAIAYSDGLDSRAVAALSGDRNEALCIRVAQHRQRRNTGDSYFTQIPFRVRGYRSDESSFRSRGFKFAAVTAIAAHLSSLTRIMAPESGQSALGPVLLPLHNIYPDYRNHPTFFRKMERFIRVLLNHHVHYDQPRLWYTKGQTLRAFLELPGKLGHELTSTRSCWQNRRIVNIGRSKRQCGLCAACLLRRQSLHAVSVNESSDTYVISNLRASDMTDALSVVRNAADKHVMMDYGSVGARHLQHLGDIAVLPDDKLRVHVSEIATATGATYQETLLNLRTLLETHAEEWKAFIGAQGERSFLKSWMVGGRYGRSK